MRIVLDYGGTVVNRIDESEYSQALETDGEVPSAAYIAYKAISLGILDTEDEYIRTLSKLTGAPEEDCRSYLEKRRNAAVLPEERRRVIEELAHEHSLVLFTDQVKVWIDRALERLGIAEFFDDVIASSELGDEKPHPKGYIRALDGYCAEGADANNVIMVSDELNADLLMADYFGMTTVWVENDREDVYVEPDYAVDDLVEIDEIIEREKEKK
ncbi:MAG: HAD family hydrolase [Halobacteria archaeon]|nr:HAD family hydrolase [Halobacteria archaeon]